MKNKWILIICIVVLGIVIVTSVWKMYDWKKSEEIIGNLLEDPTVRNELLNTDSEIIEIKAIGKGFFQVQVEETSFVIGLDKRGSGTEFIIYENKIIFARYGN